MPPQPYPIIKPHTLQKILPPPYLGIPPHPICSFPYCTSTPIYATNIVLHHTSILSLGYLDHPRTITFNYYMLPNLLHLDLHLNYSKSMSENMRITSNQRLNLTRRKRRDAGISG